MRSILLMSTILVISGCATLTNDAYVPMALSLSDGTSGTCQLTNKRMSIETEVPGMPMVRRSDDNLQINCTTEDGRTAFASIPSTVGGKIIASAVFMDLGITDAITDKHRDYPASYTVPIKARQ